MDEDLKFSFPLLSSLAPSLGQAGTTLGPRSLSRLHPCPAWLSARWDNGTAIHRSRQPIGATTRPRFAPRVFAQK